MVWALGAHSPIRSVPLRPAQHHWRGQFGLILLFPIVPESASARRNSPASLNVASACDAFSFVTNILNFFLFCVVDLLFSFSADGPCWSRFSIDVGEVGNVSTRLDDAVSMRDLPSLAADDDEVAAAEMSTSAGLPHMEIVPFE